MEEILGIAGGGTTIGAFLLWFVKSKLTKYDKEISILKEKIAEEDKINALQKEQIDNLKGEIKYIKGRLQK